MTSSLVTPAREPACGWPAQPIGEVIAAYKLSAPRARVEVDLNGKVLAGGGDPVVLEVLKARRDEVVTYLTTPCADCQREIATRLAWTPEGHIRIGEHCWESRVAREMIRAATERTANAPVPKAAPRPAAQRSPVEPAPQLVPAAA